MSDSQHNKLLPQARQLRRDMTPQERKLWYLFLRGYPVKVYKQKVIGSFIVDFYCHAARLVIEVDGTQHHTGQGSAHDDERTAFLQSRGLKVLRLTNAAIDLRFPSVCKVIQEEIQRRMNAP